VLAAAFANAAIGCSSDTTSNAKDGGANNGGGTPTPGGSAGTAGTGGAGPSTGGNGGTANGGMASSGRAGRPAGGASNGGATNGAGGSASCPMECLLANQCVTACGQTPRNYGCCPCPPGTVNALSCNQPMDAGAVSCDPRKILCKRLAPMCPEGQVPSVEGTCYGPCVPAESCVCGSAAECPDPDHVTCHLSQGRCGPYV
jgi:hypothetical protein